MADYNYYPLWDMEDPNNIAPSELPLKQETIEKLLKWAEIYNTFLNLDDPASSDFASEKEAKEFEIEGLKLWRQLQDELKSDYEVFYFSEQKGKLLNSSKMVVN